MTGNTPQHLRFRALLLLAAMFIAGAIAGAGIMGHFVPDPRPHPPPMPPGMAPYSRLGLNSAQQEQAKKILDKHRGEIDAIVHQTMPRIRAIQDTMDQEIRGVLNAEQRQQLDQMKAASGHRPRPPGIPEMMPPPLEGPPPGPPPSGAGPSSEPPGNPPVAPPMGPPDFDRPPPPRN